MRVLFVLLHPGFLRYYDSTIRELAERGHEVDVAFDALDKQQDGLKSITPPPPRVRVLGEWPVRNDAWRNTARGIRALGDCIRYLDPAFADAGYLRERMFAMVPNVFPFWPLSKLRTLPGWLVRLMQKGIALAERAVPVDPRIREFLNEQRPDVVVLTPLVSNCGRQTDLVKAARALRIPCIGGIASWDNLSSKGLIRTQPDSILVWNEAQRYEAVDLHQFPSQRVVMTGAQSYDRWFDRHPSLSREAFCKQVGLAADRPYVLFVGSSPGISQADAEYRFVMRWIDGLRDCQHPQLRDAGVMIRPYPYNRDAWSQAKLNRAQVAVWPKIQANPAAEEDRDTYFNSLYYASAIVGINTSAMVEAAIIGRPVLTLRAEEFRHSQGGTLHFRYLSDEKSGFVRTAQDFDEHYDQLDDALTSPTHCSALREEFVRRFIRPFGRQDAALPRVVDAIIATAAEPSRGPEKYGIVERLLRALFHAGIRLPALMRRGSSQSLNKEPTADPQRAEVPHSHVSRHATADVSAHRNRVA